MIKKRFLYVILTTALCLFSSVNIYAEWHQVHINEDIKTIDRIWGTSPSNMFAISFDGAALRCTGDCNLKKESGWEDISEYALKKWNLRYNYYPMEVWGLDDDNVYIVGAKVDIEYFDEKFTPFIMKYNGENDDWTEIYLPEPPVYSESYWFNDVWGTAPDNLYFTNSISVDVPPGEQITFGSIWHYDGAIFTEEVRPNNDALLSGSPYNYMLIPGFIKITGFELGDGDVELFAVGLQGIILHKNTAVSSEWEILDPGSDRLNFFSLWGHSDGGNPADQVMATGFDNDTNRAIIYQYRLWDGESERQWRAMSIPRSRYGFIPPLWGILGLPDENIYYAVGSEGTALYLETNEDPENIVWRQMVTGTVSSLNDIWWGDSSSNSAQRKPAYVAGGDGNIYYFDGEITQSGVTASPVSGVAPLKVVFSDISVGNVVKWQWDFGEGSLPPESATADLDYKILLTSPPGAEYNEITVAVIDNGNNSDAIIPPSYTISDPVAPTIDIAGKIIVTGTIKEWMNGLPVNLRDGGDGSSPSVVYDGERLVISVDAETTTCKEIADALILHRLITDAVCDDENEVWTIDDINAGNATFSGCRYRAYHVAIESGKTTQAEIAAYLENSFEFVVSAVPDNPDYMWTVGNETYSNSAAFTGGSDNPNIYINENQNIDYCYMAEHTYKTVGEYTARLTITRPGGWDPLTETNTIRIKVEENPLKISASSTAISRSEKILLSYTGADPIAKGGRTSSIVRLDWHFFDETGSSGDNPNTISTDSPSEVVSHIYSEVGLYDVSITATLENGLQHNLKNENFIGVYPDTVDFQVDNRVGSGKLNVAFKYTGPSQLIVNEPSTQIKTLEWNYGDPSGSNMIENGVDQSVSHIYSEPGFYGVSLRITLENGHVLNKVKEGFIEVFPEVTETESKSSGGGSCFIEMTSL